MLFFRAAKQVWGHRSLAAELIWFELSVLDNVIKSDLD